MDPQTPTATGQEDLKKMPLDSVITYHTEGAQIKVKVSPDKGLIITKIVNNEPVMPEIDFSSNDKNNFSILIS